MVAEDFQRYVESQLGQEAWLTVYEFNKRSRDDVAYFCALATPEVAEASLSAPEWDLLIGSGASGVVYYPNDGGHLYERFVTTEGVEPFVFSREFHGLKPSYLEVSEE